jgi:YD repeat-containing protein
MVATTYSAGSLASITVGLDGSVYFVENGYRIIRLGTDGRLYHYAGKERAGRSYAPLPDGTQAKQAELGGAISIRLGPGGLLYVASVDRNKIFVIDGDGTVRTLVGTGNGSTLAFNLGKPPLATDGTSAADVTFGPYGTMYFLAGQTYHTALFQVAPVSLTMANGQYEIPSNDGSEIYVFDNSGRHMRTRNALTGRMIFSFAYDASGRLSDVMDRDSLVSHIERDGSGNITAVVSPKGERTQLALGADGMLSGVTNPNNEQVRFRYSESGPDDGVRFDGAFDFSCHGRDSGCAAREEPDGKRVQRYEHFPYGHPRLNSDEPIR